MMKPTIKVRLNDDGEGSGHIWAVFPRAMKNHTIKRVMAQAGVPVDSEHCRHEYDCCGNTYNDGLFIWAKGSRKLATVSYYTNV
jgi:hypothetical protein